MNTKGNNRENEFLLSVIVGDKEIEDTILEEYSNRDECDTTDLTVCRDPFLDYLRKEGVLTQGISSDDVHVEDTPDAVWIDPIIRDYYQYRRRQFAKII